MVSRTLPVFETVSICSSGAPIWMLPWSTVVLTEICGFGFSPRPLTETTVGLVGSLERMLSDSFLFPFDAGAKVTLVSRLDGIGSALPFPPVTVGAARERLYSGDFDFIGNHYLRAINEDSVEIGVSYTDRKRTIPARTIVIVGFNEPNRSLAEELAVEGIDAQLVGDVRGRNSIMSAIHAGAKLGRAI